MARPRTPSNILELRGAFRAHPERQRQDAEGAGEFKREPPETLAGSARRAWDYLVQRLPRITLTGSDEPIVERAAVTLGALWALEQRMGEVAPTLPEHARLQALLLRQLAELGLSPRSRATLATSAPAQPSRFAALRDLGDDER